MEATVVKSTKDMSYEQWQQWRKDHPTIGGSTASAVLGINPWVTPLQAYMELITGESDFVETEAVAWGRALEDPVAQEWSRRKGLRVKRRNAILAHKEHPFLTANLDRLVTENGEQKVLEIKTAGLRSANHWGDDGSSIIPENYLCQIMHYLSITGLDNAYCVCLLGGQEMRTYPLSRHQPLIDQMTEKLTSFWHNNVLRRVPPAPVNGKDVQLLMPLDDGNWRDVKGDERSLLEERQRLNYEMKALKLEMEQIDNQLKINIGNGQGITANGNKVASFKTQARNSLSSEMVKTLSPEIYAKCCTKKEFRVLRFHGDYR